MSYSQIFVSFTILLLFSCQNTSSSAMPVDSNVRALEIKQFKEHATVQVLPDTTGKTIQDRFGVPIGYTRVPVEAHSFGNYLRQLPLKKHSEPVRYYNGQIKHNRNVYLGVVDMDIGQKDLQQCADAVMRLRAEYLLKEKAYDQIHFNFTNGFKADYSKWRTGYRISVNGNRVSWQSTSSESKSYRSFRKYMEQVFMYAGTLSLAKELISVGIEDMQIGDVFIRGGSPGHAVIVVDMAESENKDEKLFLLAQSYMPAQDIQILKNPNDDGLSPWYSTNINQALITPEWTFERDQLKRFE